MPAKRRRPEPPLVEIGATLITDCDRGRVLPWRVCRIVSAQERACWRFAEQDDLRLFLSYLQCCAPLGPYALSPELDAQMDHYAAKLGGAREVLDAGPLTWPA